ncbi:hypothetical protein GWO43_10210 [candidate division KSB1 bacterium]|nr:hypothetical protein [candidate division KSB1 bacterium]NIS24320.1 hypothetical protein [candidate division KSB1 bacterium]NIT71248.1 hypothetical protein [candidate division KSB1 bacterium]NIU24952.1 hypothetical protein [candidate division KSB1 bacterium]NIU90652.1 hypothetical protein [candidate division KSB1 bacterium]
MLILLFIFLMTTTLFAQVGEDGLTYVQRKQKWLRSVPEPRRGLSEHRKRLYFSAWLQKGIYNAAVSDALHSILGDFWLTGGRSHHGYMIALIVKYGSKGLRVIDSDDEMTVRNKYENDLILNSGVFEDLNPNKQLWAMAGIYLYAHYFDKDIKLPIYGHRRGIDPKHLDLAEQNWPTFSHDGRTYRFGQGPYNAKQLTEDYIKNKLNLWILDGNREMDSLNYHRAFVGSMLLIYDMAEDREFQKRARMGAELAMLDAMMDFGGSEWGGTIGRTDFRRMAKVSDFPFYEYFGKSTEDDGRPDIKVLYTFDYEPPPLLIDIAVLSDEDDDYFHFHKEYHNSGLKHRSGKGKWNYVTPLYNLGSNVGGHNSGWQVTIRGDGPGRFIRLWINDLEHIEDKNETRYLGNAGNQYRNALFAQIGANPVLHEAKERQDWDEDLSDGGWYFKRLNKVYVAIGTTHNSASVELGIKNVDYDSFTSFKNAVKKNARLTESSYTTSKGVSIDWDEHCGLNSPGDCAFPFERMETISKDGKMISWQNKVMTIRYHGKTLTYDFNNWRADDPPKSDPPPAPPSGVTIEVD